MGFIKNICVRVFRIFKKWEQTDTYDNYKKKYSLDSTFRFNGHEILIYGEGKLKVGKKSYIGSNSTIQLDEGCEVRIGHNCRISHNVRIYTSSAIADQDFMNFASLKKHQGNVSIGDGVWIGVNVFINPGVTIGNNAVIGANSVVTKDMPENSICGGVPARLIKYKSQNA